MTMLVISRIFMSITLWLVLGILSAHAQTNSAPGTNNVSGTQDKSNQGASLKENRQIYSEALWRALLKILHTAPVNWGAFENGARELIKDFPTKPNGYFDTMILAEHYETDAPNPEKARQLAKEMDVESTPEQFRLWAEGYLSRLDSLGKPVVMQFTAVDGREGNGSGANERQGGAG